MPYRPSPLYQERLGRRLKNYGNRPEVSPTSNRSLPRKVVKVRGFRCWWDQKSDASLSDVRAHSSWIALWSLMVRYLIHILVRRQSGSLKSILAI